MNWLDFVIFLLILNSVVFAIVRGLAHQLIRLTALLLGILMGLWWYPELARFIQPWMSSEATAGFVSFLAILLGFIFLGWFVSRIISALIKAAGLRWFDRLLGAAFGLVRGVLVSAVLVLAMLAFLPGKGPAETVAQSRLAPAVLYCARGIVALAPQKLKEGFESGLDRVRAVWREDTV